MSPLETSLQRKQWHRRRAQDDAEPFGSGEVSRADEVSTVKQGTSLPRTEGHNCAMS
jgi:hypothetical protein